MNKIIKTLLNKTMSEIIANGKCVSVNGTRYFLDEGALYSLKSWQSSPEWIKRFDYGNTEKAVDCFISYLSDMIDLEIEYFEEADLPTPENQIVWF